MSCSVTVSESRSSRSWWDAARRSSPIWPRRHGITDYTTDLDAALADPRWEIYADFLVTGARAPAIRKAIAAGKAIYTEKPTAETLEEALELAALARAAGVKNGVVHDKLYLPGLQQAAAPDRLGVLRAHPLGPRRVRLLGLRRRLAGRPAAELELPRRRRRRHRQGHVPALELRAGEPLRSGRDRSTRARRRTSPPASTRHGKPYAATADDAAYAVFELDGRRDRPAQLQLDGAGRPQGARRVPGRRHPRQRRRRPVRLPDPAPQRHPEAGRGTPTSPTPTTTPPTG